MKEVDIREVVRERYGRIAEERSGCCPPSRSCGCDTPLEVASKSIGYSTEQLSHLPEGANLGLGCGNPTALAGLKNGEVVLDLGSGGGIDCFLAAQAVGKTGRVIGVDMTPDMVEKARANAEAGGFENAEFRLGEIENLPVADSSIDVILSNCVINLSPDKRRVFEEAYRVLKPGGRLMVSDIVTLGELPKDVREDSEAWSCCIAGAMAKEEYLETIRRAGFGSVVVDKSRTSGDRGDSRLTGRLESVSIRAEK